jgi:hypothetical protein
MRWRSAVLLGALGVAGSLLVCGLPATGRANPGALLVIDGETAMVREAVGYKKGRRAKVQLVTLGWAEVELGTARAFIDMYRAAAETGIELYILSGFRSYEDQERFYQAYREGWGNKAARPGYSNHQTGRALDIYLGYPGTLDWLEAHGKRFGFKRTVRSEPWHWEYQRPRGKRAKKKRLRKRDRS